MLTPEQEANVAHHVFVYGTLKRGECNHGFLARFQGVSAQAEGIVLHAGPCYPYAVRGEDTASGEVYTVDNLTLAKLDTLEEHPSYYVRELIPVRREDGGIIQAWIYLNEKARQYPRLASGLWRGTPR
jgi:gamma-glutamylcyclotransferase (GGCT)/AIG2-like uncharacterized protein YtfP